MSKLGEHEERREHGEQGKDGKHQPDDLRHFIIIQNTLSMIQNTLFVTQSMPFVNQITRKMLCCGIYADC